jgi:hypothetical protein
MKTENSETVTPIQGSKKLIGYRHKTTKDFINPDVFLLLDSVVYKYSDYEPIYQDIQTSDSTVTPMTDEQLLAQEEYHNQLPHNVIIPKEIERLSESDDDIWDEAKFEYTEYQQAQFDSGNDYLPLLEWLKKYYSIKIK